MIQRSGVSSVSSDDSLPLGCDAQHLAVLKLSRDLKSKYKGRAGDTGTCETVQEERPSVRLASESSDFILRNLPCVRFYLDNSQDAPSTAATQYIQELLGADGDAKVCMMRMQEPLVCTETDPGRPFKCTLNRDVTVAIGVIAEGRNKIGALPKRFQVPTRIEKMGLVLVDAKRGDVLTLHASPAVSYHVAKSAAAAKTMRGDLCLYRNDAQMQLADVRGPPGLEAMPCPHDFAVQDGICGVIFWVGGLTDAQEG